MAKRWAMAKRIMDIPNARSSHSRPMPRAGGVGIVVTLCVATLVIASFAQVHWPSMLVVLASALGVAAVGLMDDLRGLPAHVRFGVHVLAAAAAVTSGARIDIIAGFSLGPAGPALSVLWIVAVTNIYNFMDGIDGIAAGVAVLAGLGLATLSTLHGDPLLVLLSSALAGSSLGFLVHNFPPASVFMGDVGSGFIGFVLAVLVLLVGSTSSQGNALLPASFVLAPFLVDATLTLARRVARGERWYEAHRSHYYQRLVILGYSHRVVSLLYYGLTLVAIVGSIAYVWGPEGLGIAILLASATPLVVLLIAVPRLESRAVHPKANHG
jgi:UDP-N-acetylmuramyl pentapeptide phosphotransferase/UDP-N-acetylglucosamine-1-phosphate transferase